MKMVKHKFVVWGDPRGKGRPRFTMRGHAFTDQLTTEYEGRVRKAWRSETFYRLEDVPITIIINAYFRVPVSLSKKKREALFSTEYMHKPDVDNIGKIILDALNGFAYQDDRQIACLMVNKWYVASDGEQPRVEVEIIGGEDKV